MGSTGHSQSAAYSGNFECKVGMAVFITNTATTWLNSPNVVTDVVGIVAGLVSQQHVGLGSV